jgi:uncharacterized membrane protein YphA (DoxX/SURF4 family)
VIPNHYYNEIFTFIAKISTKLEFSMKKTLILILRLMLGATFLVSATAKFITPAAFGQSLASFGLLSSALAPVFTYLIPAIELVLALALLSRVQVEKAALVSAVMLVIFIAAAASAGISGAVVENCGCFGEIYRSGLGVGFFVRNGTLLILVLLLIWLNEAELASLNVTVEELNETRSS